MRNSYFFVGKPEGVRLLGRYKHRWEDNIKIDLEIGSEDVDWIHLAQDRVKWWALVNTGNEPSGSIKGKTFLIRRGTV
jgi:hypothetical protein